MNEEMPARRLRILYSRRAEVGARGYATVRHEFCFEAMGEELEQFLLEVVASPR
jgi:hypothetical protein